MIARHRDPSQPRAKGHTSSVCEKQLNMSREMHQRVREAAQKGQEMTQTRILVLEHSSQAVECEGTNISEGVQVLQAVSEIFVPGGNEHFGGPNIM